LPNASGRAAGANRCWQPGVYGKKVVLLHMMAGSKEDAKTVSEFFQDIRARGLNDPPYILLRRVAIGDKRPLKRVDGETMRDCPVCMRQTRIGSAESFPTRYFSTTIDLVREMVATALFLCSRPVAAMDLGSLP
jgi:hypothetical protein